MTIGAFLKRERWTETKLAHEVEKALPGCSTSQTTIHRLKRRQQRARLELALAIERATDGRVRAEEVPLTRASRRTLELLRSRSAA